MKKNVFKLIYSLILITSFYSCDLDINDTPNDPTADLITPDLVLAGAQTRSYSSQAITMNQLGNVFMNNWAANVNAFTGGFAEEFQLNITSTFYNNIWDGLYIRLGGFQSIIDFNDPKYAHHTAIAKIMKSFYIQYLVDLYGDIPYEEAFRRGDNLTPAYSDALTIYRDLIIQLDDAVFLIENTTPELQAVGSEDVVFQGAMSEWLKFANTLKLKILIRQATLAETDGDTQTYLNQEFQSLQGVEFMTSAVTINPGYTQDTDRQNPFFGTYGRNVDGTLTTSNRFVVASDYAVKFLDGSLTGVNDPRINSIYKPTSSGIIVGAEQGVDSDNAPDELSPLGDGLLISDSQDGILMTAAESYFLQSEAAFRGYIGGDAKSLFQDGIRASFSYFELDATGYIAASNNISEIGWDGSANKIEAIMTQKWIATNGINAIESWIEYTRTGFPDIPLAIGAQFPNKPNRLLYPSSEYIANSANVPNQQQSDAFSTYIFWDSTRN